MTDKLTSKFNILISYAHLKSSDYIKTLLLKYPGLRIMIDSGAFTMFHSSNPKLYSHVNVKDHISFMERIREIREETGGDVRCVGLDVVGNPEKTKENYKITKKSGVDFIPVFTRGASLQDLDWLLDKEEYICIGNVGASRMRNNVERFMALLVKKYGLKTFQRFHLLGYTRLRRLPVLKPRSVDSQTFNSPMFGYYGKLTTAPHGKAYLEGLEGKCRNLIRGYPMDAYWNIYKIFKTICRTLRNKELGWHTMACSWMEGLRIMKKLEAQGTTFYYPEQPDISVTGVAREHLIVPSQEALKRL